MAPKNEEVVIRKAKFSLIDTHIFRVCKDFSNEARTALASCLVMKFCQGIPTLGSIPVSFGSFYIPSVRHITLPFRHVRTFDAAIFPSLRRFEIGGSHFQCAPAKVHVYDVAESVALLGGAMNRWIIEEMPKDWTEDSSDENFKTMKELISTTGRRFTILHTILALISCWTANGPVFGEMVSGSQGWSYAGR
jgi:hypothetical protein